MDSGTRRAVKRDRTAKRAIRRDAQEQKFAQQTHDRELKTAKKLAIREVNTASKKAAERFRRKDPTSYHATVEFVCNHTGPHHGFRCFLHGRRRVALVRIPRARGNCDACPSHYGNYSSWQYKIHMGIWLGLDGKIYRYGHTKIFKIKLMDRDSPEDILVLVPKLNAMR